MKHFVNLKLGEGAKAPVKKHDSDACYDLFANSGPEIVGDLFRKDDSVALYRSIDYIQYRTGIFTQPEYNDEFMRFDARPRSSISKYWLSLCNAPATIDHDYTGEWLVRFNYLWQYSDIHQGSGITVNTKKIYSKGDKIIQIMPAIVDTIEFKIVDELKATERADKGFGEGTGK